MPFRSSRKVSVSLQVRRFVLWVKKNLRRLGRWPPAQLSNLGDLRLGSECSSCPPASSLTFRGPERLWMDEIHFAPSGMPAPAEKDWNGDSPANANKRYGFLQDFVHPQHVHSKATLGWFGSMAIWQYGQEVPAAWRTPGYGSKLKS